MFDVVEEWLKSGKYAEVAGLKLRPIENQLLKNTPLLLVRGQAQAFYLRDEQNLDWILKKFLPARLPDSAYIKGIQSLIPRQPGFQSGYLRQIISAGDVAKSGFSNANFVAWIEKTVLMSRIKCDDWIGVADKIRNGSLTLSDNERITLCQSLNEKIGLLENANLSHRDLSVTNVFVDVQSQLIHLIDWDSLFHPSLTMPRNTTFGTEGYIAPFVKKSGTPDPRITWRPRADRFSMAILNAEFLCMDLNAPFTHDGGMFEQSELYQGGGPETTRIIRRLQQKFPSAAKLLEKALQAQSFDSCPSPAQWLALGNPINAPSFNVAAAAAPSTTSPSHAARPVNPGSFAVLDEAAFVQLDAGAFVPLM